MSGCVEEEEGRPRSPALSCVSMRTDWSKDFPPDFSNEPKPDNAKGIDNQRIGYLEEISRPRSPALSCVSIGTDWSKDFPPDFSNEPGPADTKRIDNQIMSGCLEETDRPRSPALSCVSMGTDWSKDFPPDFSNEPGPSNTKPRSPALSCVSVKTDWSKDFPPDFSKEPGPSNTKRIDNQPSCVSVKTDWSKDFPPDFSNEPGPSNTKPTKARKKSSRVGVKEDREKSPVPSCVSVKTDWSKDFPPDFSNEPEPPNTKWCKKQTSHWNQSIQGSRKGPGHQTADAGPQEVYDQHKVDLKRKFEHVTEGSIEAGSRILLNTIYTELYITEGQSEDVISQHEVKQLERASKLKSSHQTSIKCHQIFQVLTEQQNGIRVVMTNGVAGVGKTFSVWKFTLDWAEGLENQDVGLLILFSFRELNLVKDEQFSLLGLLRVFHPKLQKVTAVDLALCKPLFIFDGLDESRLPLDFSNGEVVSDVTQESSVSLLLTNLIRGDLLPSALIWITSRPAAAHRIPPACIDRVTEVRGFNDVQKEEYFRRRFRVDDELGTRIISHITKAKSLHIMCQIPVFCWISATVLEHMLTTVQGGELPKTLTDLYSHFLLVQIKMNKNKYGKGHESSPQELTEADGQVILKLGRLAFEHLQKGNIMFYEGDLEHCGLDVTVASVYSGVCTKIFKEECVIFQKSVYCFVHLSIQEFLAAVYFFYCHTSKDTEVMEEFLENSQRESWRSENNYSVLDQFLKRAMEVSLTSENGHLDLFVRFLHGLSLESNQGLLGGLLGRTDNSLQTITRVTDNLKKLNVYSVSPDRTINIFHCLMEMKDQSVHNEIQEYLKSGTKRELSEIHCSALAYMLQMSEEVVDELDLYKYNTCEDVRQRLIPAVRNCRKARMTHCRFSEVHSEVVASALKSNPSHLRELDLGLNRMDEATVRKLCTGLESPNCQLSVLRLSDCSLSETSIKSLASALESHPSHLTALDLSFNDPRDSGVKELCRFLQHPDCRLKTLNLYGWSVTQDSCLPLASALMSNPSHLRELVLSGKQLQDSGVKELCRYLENPKCHLECLRLSSCDLSEVGASALGSALESNPSHLTELDLSSHSLQDSGVEKLCGFVKSPGCQLKTLKLEECGMTEVGCSILASALLTNPSHLTELDLSGNEVQDSGVMELCAFLHSPSSQLKTLRLPKNSLSEISCMYLASALISNPSHLIQLDLSKNDLQDGGVMELCVYLQSLDCHLKSLSLWRCKLSDVSLSSLVSALMDNPSHLEELHVGDNALHRSDVELLLELVESPDSQLKTLKWK